MDIFSKFWLFPYRFIPVQETIIERDRFSKNAIAKNSLKLLNWNIAKRTNEKIWMKDFIDIVEIHQPDIICLQEVTLDTETKTALAIEMMGWTFAPNFIDRYHNTYCGILTASRVKPLVSRSLLSEQYEPFTKTPKVSLISEYSVGKLHEIVLVINVHAINFVDLNKFKSQLDKIEQFISHRNEPIILTGDFNTWSQMRFEVLKQMAGRLNLKTVLFSEYDKNQIKNFLFSPPLDHIYYRGFQEKDKSATVLDHIDSSDHKPLLVEFFVIE